MLFSNLGVHVGYKDVGSVDEFAGVFQMCLRNPNEMVDDIRILRSHALDWRKRYPGQILINHAPFEIDLFRRDFQKSSSYRILKNHLLVCEEFDIPYVVIHPGTFSMHDNSTDLLLRVIDSLNILLSDKLKGCKVKLLLENLPLYNSLSIEDLLKIDVPGVGVCLDTNHAHGYGYTQYQFSEFLNNKNVRCIHLNSIPRESVLGDGCDCHVETPIQDSVGYSLEFLLDILTSRGKLCVMEQHVDTLKKSLRFLRSL